MNTVGCCNKAVPAPEVVQAIAANLIYEGSCTKQEEKTMYNKDERTEAQQAKDYLIESLNQAIRKQDIDLRETFNLNSSHGLQTFGDLRKAIKEGWINVDDAYKDMDDKQPLFDSPKYLIQVFNPKKMPDREGFDKASKVMRQAASEVKDQIVVFGPEKGLEALNSFKAKTFH